MKILYVCNVSNVPGAGGMEYHLLDVAGWLERKGVDLAFAVREGTFLERNLLAGRHRTYPLSWTGWRKVFSFVQYLRALFDFAPDIVSINRERDIVRIFLLTKAAGPFLETRPRIAAVFHNPDAKRFFVLGRLDGVAFTSEYTRRGYLPRNRGAAANSVIIHHGIRLDPIDPVEKLDPGRRRRFFAGREFPIVGMVGELRKNQAELVDVAYHLRNHRARFTIAVVGRGPEETIRAMEERIRSLGLAEHFVFTGRVDRERIPEVFHDLDLSVSTYRGEGFGIVHIESLAARTPVVAYNAGGPVEILGKGGGVLVDGGPKEMADAIHALLSDDRARREMAIRGRETAERWFSLDAMGERHHAFYEGLVRGRDRSAPGARPPRVLSAARGAGSKTRDEVGRP